MKNQLWALALFGTSVLTANGCQQVSRMDAPCSTCGTAGCMAAAPVDAFAIMNPYPRLVATNVPSAVRGPAPVSAPEPAEVVVAIPPPPSPVPAPMPIITDNGPVQPVKPSIAQNSPAQPAQEVVAERVSIQPVKSTANPSVTWSSSFASGTASQPLAMPDIIPAPASPAASQPAPIPDVIPAATRAAPSTPGFSHSDDYSVLTGQVQLFRQIWKLRYADYSTPDQFGGSLILEGDHLDSLQAGCQVRARGRLIPAKDKMSSPRFRVLSMEVIGR